MKRLMLIFLAGLLSVGCVAEVKAPLYKPAYVVATLQRDAEGNYHPLAHYPLRIRQKTEDGGYQITDIVTNDEGLATGYLENWSCYVQDAVTGIELPAIGYPPFPMVFLMGGVAPQGILIEGEMVPIHWEERK